MRCGLPTPEQYRRRANDAMLIGSIDKRDKIKIASRIALAELVQIVFFVVLAVLYSLAFTGYISPSIAGKIALALLPIEAISSFNTFVLYRPANRYLLTAAAVLTLALCAGFAVSGIVTDSAITLCGGGVVLHILRNLSEKYDNRNALKIRLS